MMNVRPTFDVKAAFAVMSTFVFACLSPAAAADFDSMMPAGWADCYASAPCQADNANHTVYVSALGPRFQTAVEASLNLSYATTDLTISYTSEPSSSTDVKYGYGTLPRNVGGQTYCLDAQSSAVCGQFRIVFDADNVCAFGCSNNFLRAIACHETGHTVGLLHGEDALPPVRNTDIRLGCLRTPLSEGDTYALGQHNATEINYTYR